jgi:hypothetical protein
MESEPNPLKIDNRLYYHGDPMQVFQDFKELGFKFEDHPMPENHPEFRNYFRAR